MLWQMDQLVLAQPARRAVVEWMVFGLTQTAGPGSTSL